MYAFPALIPDQLLYDAGYLNVSESSTLSSGPIRFKHSLTVNNHVVKLRYLNRTETEVDRIRQHYLDAAGQHHTFTLPTSVWGGANVVGSASLFRYNNTPEEIHLNGIYHDIDVELVVLTGPDLSYILGGEQATLSAETAVESFLLTGNAPFILNEDDAVPTAATYLLEAGGSQT